MPPPTLADVESLASRLTPEEQLMLVEHLAQRVRQAGLSGKSPQSLYGLWKGHVPEDFDVDGALKEIRSEWLKELDEMEEQGG